MGPYASLLLAAVRLGSAAAPAAEYSQYLGDTRPYHIARLVVDAAGNTLVAGSRNFNISPDPFNPRWMTGAFVLRLDAAGKRIGFAALSGKGNDGATGLALDRAGNVYIAGATSSPDLSECSGPTGPGFVAKYSPDLGRLLFCTYFPDAIQSLAVDAAGSVYVTGTTYSKSFPVTPGLPAGGVTSGVPMTSGAFLTKLAANGDRIVYSTVLSGGEKNCGCCSSCFTSSRTTTGVAVAVDAAGNAYLAGNTDTLDLPTTPQAMQHRGPGAFVAKLNAAGTALDYLTYLGTGNLVISPNSFPMNRIADLTVDAAGRAYIVGSTFDPQFPATPGVWQTTAGSGGTDPAATDAFALVLASDGSAPVWATYLGGAGADAALSTVLDAAGNLWIAGTTRSTDFPNREGWSNGGDFVVALSAAGTALPYSARYPDGSVTQLAVDAAGLLHLGGTGGIVSVTAPSPRPAMRAFGIANAAYGTLGGIIAPGELVSIYGPQIGPGEPVSRPAISHGREPTLLRGLQVLVNGIPAPVFYASSWQINAMVPYAIIGDTSARIRIVLDGMPGLDFEAIVVPADPQIFQAAVNQDGTLNSPEHPALPSSVVTIWATGVALPPPVFGVSLHPAVEETVYWQLFWGTRLLTLESTYSSAPLIGGVYQVAFRLPADFTSGEIRILSGGVLSAPFFVWAQE
jgi:uncharacterized protein (TIGR03437 family)